MLSQEFFQKLRLPDLDEVSQYIRNVSTPMLVSMGAMAAATTYYLATRPKALPPVCDLLMQSVEVPVSLKKSICQSRVNTKAVLTCKVILCGSRYD